MNVLNEYIELMLMVYVIESIMAALGLAFYAVAGERIATRLRNTVYSCILSQDVAFFDTTPAGELINRIVNDTSVLTSESLCSQYVLINVLVQV